MEKRKDNLPTKYVCWGSGGLWRLVLSRDQSFCVISCFILSGWESPYSCVFVDGVRGHVLSRVLWMEWKRLLLLLPKHYLTTRPSCPTFWFVGNVCPRNLVVISVCCYKISRMPLTLWFFSRPSIVNLVLQCRSYWWWPSVTQGMHCLAILILNPALPWHDLLKQ